ncbi:MAG: hypothetical protein J6L88_04410 [Clostridia bacterium]|nr:hypothetical protein [Clostridia bacterium]
MKPIKSNKPLGQPPKPKKKTGAKSSSARPAQKKSGGAVYPTFSSGEKKPSSSSKKSAPKRDESVLFYKSTPPKKSVPAKKQTVQKKTIHLGNAKRTRSYTPHNTPKRRRTGALFSVAALMMMVGALLIFVCFGPGSQYAASYISDVHASFTQMEEQLQVEQNTDTQQEVPSLLDRAEENAQTLVEDGTIDSYEVGEDCVYMETPDGLGMVYLPGVEETIPEDEQPVAAPTPTPTPVATPSPTPSASIAPSQSAAATPIPVASRRVISLQPCYDMFLSSFTTAELENIDETAARFGTLEGYLYDPNLDDYDNAACTVELLKSLGEYDVIIWEGHGGYSSTTGSFLLTGQEYTAAFHRQNEADFQDGSLISTTDGRVAVTAKFFDKYLEDGALDGALIYLAACSTSTDDVLVSTLLSKGAKCVFANSGVVYTVYNYAMLDKITSLLCGQQGTFQSPSEALTNAQLLYGYYDNYRLSTQAGIPSNYSVVQVFGDAQMRFS